MKIILTGATGFIGLEVLRQCIKHLYISHVYCIVRKPLPEEFKGQRKVTEIIHDDFENWPGPQLETLKDDGVSGVIWCVGGAITAFKDFDEAQRCNVTLPLIAAEAFSKYLVPDPSAERAKPFRFVYMSVVGAEQNSLRSLWSQAQTRKMKGAAEKGLFEIADSEATQSMFEAYSLRLGKVLPGGQTLANILTESVSYSVTVERVAKVAIDTVIDGRTEKQGGRIVENAAVLGDDWAQINIQNI